MQIDNEFSVRVPIQQAWAVLTDLPAIAPCMPGAQLTGVEGEVYSGKVKVKVGPVTSEYSGTASFTERDDEAFRAVIDARGRDVRGAGNASALITAHLRPDGPHTIVNVSTDLRISGRIAQFGSGMIKEVSAKLLGQFVECLEGKLSLSAADQEGLAAAAAGAAAGGTEPPVTGGATQPAAGPAGEAPGQAGPAAMDLLSVAGGSIYKRLIPLIVVLIVIVGLIVYFAVR